MLDPSHASHIRKTLCGPEPLSDEHVDAFARANASTVWHACGTVRMGKRVEEGVCVDSGGWVFGVEGLRVLNLGVCPVVTSDHMQATAYLVGQRGWDGIRGDWGL
jgi:choline dehydrogenase-like flavoprotein